MTRFTWPKGGMWQTAAGILAVATCVEMVQIWIPVDKAAASHAILDFGGGVIGFGAACLADYAGRAEHLPSEYQHSTV
ncbi:hypothetical protein JJ685_06770 [Ramlibacter monticola]|uniref:Uncharacterized protein n=1 Tax=Ramlibacter monticola TaxID=1926872 RepID=A0A937CRJ5_9BURK|nr:hypothetical protein [Ramlibacter monticola]MBL0390840.1 hypothetical protein [Ramlibacter monticola]